MPNITLKKFKEGLNTSRHNLQRAYTSLPKIPISSEITRGWSAINGNEAQGAQRSPLIFLRRPGSERKDPGYAINFISDTMLEQEVGRRRGEISELFLINYDAKAQQFQGKPSVIVSNSITLPKLLPQEPPVLVEALDNTHQLRFFLWGRKQIAEKKGQEEKYSYDFTEIKLPPELSGKLNFPQTSEDTPSLCSREEKTLAAFGAIEEQKAHIPEVYGSTSPFLHLSLPFQAKDLKADIYAESDLDEHWRRYELKLSALQEIEKIKEIKNPVDRQKAEEKLFIWLLLSDKTLGEVRKKIRNFDQVLMQNIKKNGKWDKKRFSTEIVGAEGFLDAKAAFFKNPLFNAQDAKAFPQAKINFFKDTLKEARRFFAPVLLGVERLHKSGFAHTDLKLENIFLFKVSNVVACESLRVKIEQLQKQQSTLASELSHGRDSPIFVIRKRALIRRAVTLLSSKKESEQTESRILKEQLDAKEGDDYVFKTFEEEIQALTARIALAQTEIKKVSKEKKESVPRLQAMIADWDDVIQIDALGKKKKILNSTILTPEYAAPEYSLNVYPFLTSAYDDLDLRRQDCYSLGVILQLLSFDTTSDSLRGSQAEVKVKKELSAARNKFVEDNISLSGDEELKNLYKNCKDLIGGLTSDVEKRWTITQAKESEFFGKTTEERQKFFADIEREAISPELQGYYIRGAPPLGDPFFTLAEEIQPVVSLAKDLSEQLSALDGATQFIDDAVGTPELYIDQTVDNIFSLVDRIKITTTKCLEAAANANVVRQAELKSQRGDDREDKRLKELNKFIEFVENSKPVELTRDSNDENLSHHVLFFALSRYAAEEKNVAGRAQELLKAILHAEKEKRDVGGILAEYYQPNEFPGIRNLVLPYLRKKTAYGFNSYLIKPLSARIVFFILMLASTALGVSQISFLQKSTLAQYFSFSALGVSGLTSVGAIALTIGIGVIGLFGIAAAILLDKKNHFEITYPKRWHAFPIMGAIVGCGAVLIEALASFKVVNIDFGFSLPLMLGSGAFALVLAVGSIFTLLECQKIGEVQQARKNYNDMLIASEAAVVTLQHNLHQVSPQQSSLSSSAAPQMLQGPGVPAAASAAAPALPPAVEIKGAK